VDNSKNKTPALQSIHSLLIVCDPGLIFQKAKMIQIFFQIIKTYYQIKTILATSSIFIFGPKGLFLYQSLTYGDRRNK
jgi:hypothetical protein